MNGQRIETGTVFGTLTVIGSIVDSKNKTKYILRCTCGHECYKIGYETRKNKRCQKCNSRNLIGRKNQKCTIIRHIKGDQYECKCDCGNIYIGRYRSKSCGCHLREKYIANAKTLEGYSNDHIKILRFLRFDPIRVGKASIAIYLVRCRYCRKTFEVIRSRTHAVKSCGCQRYKTQKWGQEQGSAKLSNIQVQSALELYLSAQYSIKEISEMTSISISSLHGMIKGDEWKHLKVDQNLLENSPLKESFRKTRFPRHNIQPGQRYGSWTVLSRGERRNKHRYWLCRCDCGKEKQRVGSALARGKTKKCGDCQVKYFVSREYKKQKIMPL